MALEQKLCIRVTHQIHQNICERLSVYGFDACVSECAFFAHSLSTYILFYNVLLRYLYAFSYSHMNIYIYIYVHTCRSIVVHTNNNMYTQKKIHINIILSFTLYTFTRIDRTNEQMALHFSLSTIHSYLLFFRFHCKMRGN